MLKKILPLFAVLLLPAWTPASALAQADQKQPALVVRLASLDNAFENLTLVGGFLGGAENPGKKLDDAIKSRLGPRGLFGIDGQRPVGFYATVGKDISDLSSVLVLPVRGDKEFKEMLVGLGWEVSAAKDGVHSVKQNLLPVDVQYRISQKYAYVSLMGQDPLAPAALVSPEKLFAAKSKAAVSLTVHLDQVPADLRGVFLDTLKERFGAGLGKGGAKGASAFHTALAKELQQFLDSVVKDGEELNADIDIDSKTKQLTADVNLRAKSGSKLAERISKMGQRKTLFAGIVHKDAAMNALLNLDLPPEVRNALGGIIDDALKQIAKDLKDDARQKQARELLDALKPSLASDELDFALSMRGPNAANKFSMIVGLKLQDGIKVQSLLGELIKDLPDKEQKKIQLNADKVGDVGIHKLSVQDSLDPGSQQMFGDHAIYVAFRKDAFFLALGEEGLPALKEAVAGQPQARPVVIFDMSAVRMAGQLPKKDDHSRMSVTVEGGSTLQVRFTMGLAGTQTLGLQK
jgi:hypothetical protein